MKKIEIRPPSCQSLFLKMKFDGQELSTGTGFIVNTSKGYALITNRHNVTGKNNETGELLSKTGGVPNQIEILHNRKNQLGHWVSRTEKIIDNDTPLWIEHPTLSHKADFVALFLKNFDDVGFYPYALNNTNLNILVGPADPVSVIGFPFGIQAGGSLAIWATGFMASEPDIDFKGLPIFLVDCRTRPGQSGSAVIAYRSGGAIAMEDGSTAIFPSSIIKFLGIYSGRIHKDSDIGMVWKMSAIKELLDSIK